MKMRSTSVTGMGLTPFLVGVLVVGSGMAPGDSSHRADPPGTSPHSSEASAALEPPPLSVWYMGHCGFVVRIGDRILIFDYQEELGTEAEDPRAGGMEDGFIAPEDLADSRVYVFTTHSHGDHFDPVILDWEEEEEGIQYFFGWQAGENPSHHYLVGPRARTEVDGMEIYTINSHHSGVPEVAYLVHVDGSWIYHNGDYRQDFIPDFEYLATLTDHMDLVFHVGLTREVWQYTHQARYLLDHFSPGAFFPIHNGGREAEAEAFAADVLERGYDTEVILPRRRGDRWAVGG